jgi:biotin carboxylase
MKVAFIAPSYPPEQVHFTRGLAEVGATVVGIGNDPKQRLPETVKRALSAYVQVDHLFDEERAAVTIARALAGHGIERVESNWEPVVLLAARVRELLGIPGMSRDTVLGFRDKQLMKERLRAAGLRVPHSRRCTSPAEVRAAAAEIGLPIIIKPIAGAGSADTYRCDTEADLERALGLSQHVPEVSVEEFVQGDEFTYDTVCIAGKPAFENVAQYFPRPLVFRTEEWISPVQIVFRNPYRADLQAGVKMGRAVLDALGMGTGFTHMEWYRKADGEVVFGEIGCRNGGGHFVDMMNWSNDFDVYREWARAVCWHSFEAEAKRAHHVGMVFKRASGQGHIAAIHGMDAVRKRWGQHIVADALLPIGSPRRNWKQTLLSDGFVGVRHPDLRLVQHMCAELAGLVRLYAR